MKPTVVRLQIYLKTGLVRDVFSEVLVVFITVFDLTTSSQLLLIEVLEVHFLRAEFVYSSKKVNKLQIMESSPSLYNLIASNLYV